MKIKAFIAGIAGALLISSAAMAADPIVIPPPMVAPVAVAPAGYDWAGPYGGISYIPGERILFGQVGFNVVRGNLVLGLEGLVGRALGNPGIILAASARVGFALGANDRVLVYGTIFGVLAGGGGIGFGPGVAFGLNDRLSLFAELYLPSAIRVGLNFQFGQ